MAAEEVEGRTVKCARIPLALDGVQFIEAVGEDEVHFMPGFVTPEADRRVGDMSLEMFQNQLFSERPEILGAKQIPTARKAYEACVEGIILGLLSYTYLSTIHTVR